MVIGLASLEQDKELEAEGERPRVSGSSLQLWSLDLSALQTSPLLNEWFELRFPWDLSQFRLGWIDKWKKAKKGVKIPSPCLCFLSSLQFRPYLEVELALCVGGKWDFYDCYLLVISILHFWYLLSQPRVNMLANTWILPLLGLWTYLITHVRPLGNGAKKVLGYIRNISSPLLVLLARVKHRTSKFEGAGFAFLKDRVGLIKATLAVSDGENVGLNF